MIYAGDNSGSTDYYLIVTDCDARTGSTLSGLEVVMIEDYRGCVLHILVKAYTPCTQIYQGTVTNYNWKYMSAGNVYEGDQSVKVEMKPTKQGALLTASVLNTFRPIAVKWETSFKNLNIDYSRGDLEMTLGGGSGHIVTSFTSRRETSEAATWVPAFTAKQDDIRQPVSWGYSFSVSGDWRNLEVDNFLYQMPFNVKTRVAQGYFGSFSHQDSFALDLVPAQGKCSGTPVVAVRGGVVETAEFKNTQRCPTGYSKRACMDNYPANMVIIYHFDGTMSFYGHFEYAAVAPVKVGQLVSEGQLIGYCGETGYASGPHVHFEIQKPIAFHKTEAFSAKYVDKTKGCNNRDTYSIEEGKTYSGYKYCPPDTDFQDRPVAPTPRAVAPTLRAVFPTPMPVVWPTPEPGPACSKIRQPCSCVGECGWSTSVNKCVQGSKTDCDECSTLAACTSPPTRATTPPTPKSVTQFAPTRSPQEKRSYVTVGEGFCRPPCPDRSASDCKVNGYWQDGSNEGACKAQCSADTSCVGYAIAAQDHVFPGRCYVYGRWTPAGWTPYPKKYNSISASSGASSAGSVTCYAVQESNFVASPPTSPPSASFSASSSSSSPVVPSSSSVTATCDAECALVLGLTNKYRREQGLEPVCLNAKLMQAAEVQSNWQTVLQEMTHDGPPGNENVGQRVKNQGYKYKKVGENVARGYKRPEIVMLGWWNSPEHRRNIEGSRYVHMGLAYSEIGHFWTQVFGAPQSGSDESCDIGTLGGQYGIEKSFNQPLTIEPAPECGRECKLVVDKVNENRVWVGASPVCANENLQRAASSYIQRFGSTAHIDQDQLEDIIADSGYGWKSYETAAVAATGLISKEAMEKAFKDTTSSKHSHVGVALSASGDYIFVIFAEPMDPKFTCWDQALSNNFPQFKVPEPDMTCDATCSKAISVINTRRSARGLAPVCWNSRLMLAAHTEAPQIAQYVDMGSLTDAVTQTGYELSTLVAQPYYYWYFGQTSPSNIEKKLLQELRTASNDEAIFDENLKHVGFAQHFTDSEVNWVFVYASSWGDDKCSTEQDAGIQSIGNSDPVGVDFSQIFTDFSSFNTNFAGVYPVGGSKEVAPTPAPMLFGSDFSALGFGMEFTSSNIYAPKKVQPASGMNSLLDTYASAPRKPSYLLAGR
jgi:uncharacterized protein YkwD/murein DD-endopeptidase MepM/ murein hydrolase activator NlpD